MCEAHLEEERTVEAERILIPVANPDTIEYLMNLSLLIRDTKQKDNLLALNVINDNNTSEVWSFAVKVFGEGSHDYGFCRCAVAPDYTV